jgi:hypothetical protein
MSTSLRVEERSMLGRGPNSLTGGVGSGVGGRGGAS